MLKKVIVFLGIFALLFATAGYAQSSRLHPVNKRLMDLGLMGHPKYYPEVPRITANAALHYYNEGKARLVLISHSDRHLIVGGIHLTEDRPPRMNPNSIPLLPDQVLITYCP